MHRVADYLNQKKSIKSIEIIYWLFENVAVTVRTQATLHLSNELDRKAEGGYK